MTRGYVGEADTVGAAWLHSEARSVRGKLTGAFDSELPGQLGQRASSVGFDWVRYDPDAVGHPQRVHQPR